MRIIKLVALLLIFSASTISLGQSKEIKVGSDQSKISPVKNRYAFIVGIDHYKDPEIQNFTSCRIDAVKFEAYLKSDQGWKMPKQNIVPLLDPKKETIISSFKQFLKGIKSPETATVYFYYSGHGVRGSIVPADYFIDESEQLISYDYIKREIDKRGIQSKVFILDACYSGSIITMKGDDDFDSNYARFIQDDEEDSNQVTFTATSDNRTTPAGKNVSVFTYHLLNALENTASDTNNDKILSSGELYAALSVELETSNPPQFAGSRNFPMAYYKKIVSPISESENPTSISTDYSSIISHGPFSIEKDGVATNWGYINADGELKIPFNYKNHIAFHNGLAKVKNYEGLYGYINKEGKTVIPFIYEQAAHFSEGIAKVTYKDEIGFIDRIGMEALPFEYRKAGSFQEGACAVQKHRYGGFYFINKAGQPISSTYFEVKPFSDGRAAVREEEYGDWAFINKEGNLAIPDRYRQVTSFSEGKASVRIGDKWGVIDTSGKFVIEPKNWVVGNFFEGKASVLYNSKYGFINTKGDPITPFIYEDVEAFSDGLAAVKVGDKWGYIDDSGQIVINTQFKYVDQFKNGYARVTSAGLKTWIIDKTGECIYGCIDSDEDGIMDKFDDCPDTYGPGFSNGCPKLEGDFKSTFLNSKERQAWLSKTSIAEITKKGSDGDVLFQRRLGFIYFSGINDATQDDETAAIWFKLAADNGDAIAQNQLGWMLGVGRGVEKDVKKKVYYYTKSAEQGFDIAQFNLGYLYHNGKGVKRDPVKAEYWFRRACAQGNQKACEKLKELN